MAQTKGELLREFDPQALNLYAEGHPGYQTLKRIIDVVAATLALIVLFPLLLFIGLLIRIDSPGPALFVQKRVGARRKRYRGQTYWQPILFPCYKFRTMYQNADPGIHRAHIQEYTQGGLRANHPDHPTYKLSNDPRVTHVGGFLRKSSLDE